MLLLLLADNQKGHMEHIHKSISIKDPPYTTVVPRFAIERFSITQTFAVMFLQMQNVQQN